MLHEIWPLVLASAIAGLLWAWDRSRKKKQHLRPMAMTGVLRKRDQSNDPPPPEAG